MGKTSPFLASLLDIPRVCLQSDPLKNEANRAGQGSFYFVGVKKVRPIS